MILSIQNRRSIRKYKNYIVPKQMIEEILQSGILAPSSKNRQPWKFIVVSNDSKNDMISVMRKGIEREKLSPILPRSSRHLNAAEYTMQIMEQAPVIIFVVNPFGLDINLSLNPEERIYEICNAQSIGASIENMILTATEMGLGSLWICDIYFAYKELLEWLKVDGELFAALAIGYPDEKPKIRPRKHINDIVEWRN